MNRFEEFGLTPSATPEQIRKAHRALVRLLHPDNFQDEEQKRLAECQMKRINAVYRELADAGKNPRRQAQSHSRPQKRRAGPGTDVGLRLAKRNAPWVVATLGSVFAIHWGLSTLGSPAKRLQEVVSQVVAAPKPEAQDAAPAQDEGRSLRALQEQNRQLHLQLEQMRAEREQASSKARWAIEPVAPVSAPRPAAIPEPAIQSKEPVAAPETAGLAGTWVYVPQFKDSSRLDLYAPEYIEVVIWERAGFVQGRYRGRYQVADRPISPEVRFQFEGKAEAAQPYVWTGNGGARGEITLKQLTEHSLAVDWVTSEFGRQTGFLSSGTATLVRRRD